MKSLLTARETIHIDEETGEILNPNKMSNYLKIKSEKTIKNGEIQWITKCRRSKNPSTKQGELF